MNSFRSDLRIVSRAEGVCEVDLCLAGEEVLHGEGAGQVGGDGGVGGAAGGPSLRRGGATAGWNHNCHLNKQTK